MPAPDHHPAPAAADAPRCPSCGYTLAGLAAAVQGGPCPECGYLVRPAADRLAAQREARSIAVAGLTTLLWAIPMCGLAAVASMAVYLWFAFAGDQTFFADKFHRPTIFTACIPAVAIGAGTVLLLCGTPGTSRWLRWAAWAAAGILALAVSLLVAHQIVFEGGRITSPGTPGPLRIKHLHTVAAWAIDLLIPLYAWIVLALLGAAAGEAGLVRLGRVCRRAGVAAGIAMAVLFAGQFAVGELIEQRNAAAQAAAGTGPTTSPFAAQPPASPLNRELQRWIRAIGFVVLTLTAAGAWTVAAAVRARLRCRIGTIPKP